MEAKRIRLAIIKQREFAPEVLEYLREFCDIGFRAGVAIEAIWVPPEKTLPADPPSGMFDSVRWVLTNTTDTGHVQAFCAARGIEPLSLQHAELRVQLDEVHATADYTEILIRYALRAVSRRDVPGRMIRGSRVALLVECAGRPGRVASQLITRLVDQGAHVQLVDPTSLDQLPRLLPHVLSVHLPAVDAYRGIVDWDLLERLPAACTLVNTSRDTLIVAKDVMEALTCGRLRRYATDFAELSGPLVIGSQHVAGYERESLTKTQWLVARKFRQLAENGAALGAVVEARTMAF